MKTYLKFWITCDQCGEKSFVIGDTVEEQKLLRSRKTMAPARITWSEDPVFDEVGDIVSSTLANAAVSPVGEAKKFDFVFARICDPAPDGSEYAMGEGLWCPRCGNRNVHWGPTDPPIYEDVEVPPVLHLSWDALSSLEKKDRIKSLLDETRKLRIGEHALDPKLFE